VIDQLVAQLAGDFRLQAFDLFRLEFDYLAGAQINQMVVVAFGRGLITGAAFAEVAAFCSIGILVGRFGEVQIAAHQIALNFSALVFMLPMGLSAAQRMVRIVLPAALPEILTGCRTGLVLALITMVTSEMIARQSGAGNILFNALDMGQYDTVYAMIIIIGAMGIGLDAAFEKLRGRLVRWSEPGFEIPLSFA